MSLFYDMASSIINSPEVVEYEHEGGYNERVFKVHGYKVTINEKEETFKVTSNGFPYYCGKLEKGDTPLKIIKRYYETLR